MNLYGIENRNTIGKADNALEAKIHFRLCKDFSDSKRYKIISVKGERKCEE